jgi:hypothetical protein
METKPITSKQYFLSLKIIFFALLAGQVMFALVAFFIAKELKLSVLKGPPWEGLMFIMPNVILVAYFLGVYLFNRKLKTARTRTSLSEKLNDYRAALLVRYALMEGTTIISLILYLLSERIVFMLFAIIGILSFSTMFSSPSRVVSQFELDPYEEQKVLDPDAEIF